MRERASEQVSSHVFEVAVYKNYLDHMKIHMVVKGNF